MTVKTIIGGSFLVFKSAASLLTKIGSSAAETEGFLDPTLNIDLNREEALFARYASPAILAFSAELGIKALIQEHKEEIKNGNSDDELKKKTKDHKIDRLFSLLPENVQNDLIEKTMQNVENKDIEFKKEIEKYSQIFIEMRYFHEFLDDDSKEEQSISFNDDFLSSLVKAISYKI